MIDFHLSKDPFILGYGFGDGSNYGDRRGNGGQFWFFERNQVGLVFGDEK